MWYTIPGTLIALCLVLGVLENLSRLERLLMILNLNLQQYCCPRAYIYSSSPGGGTYIHSYEVMFEQALENHTLNTDILNVKLWPSSRSWHGHPLILNLKLHYLLTQYTFLNSGFHFNVILIIIWGNKCHEILQKSVALHDLLEIGTLNADTWRPTAEKYTLFTQNAVCVFCLKKIPFPTFFCSNMTS